MTPVALLAPILFAVSASLAAAVGFRSLRAPIGRLGPDRRRAVLLGIAFFPILAALVLTTLAFIPSVVGLVWPAADHCSVHGLEGHPHVCFAHPATHAATPAAWLVGGTLLGAAALLAAAQVYRLHEASSLVRRLRRVARPEPKLGVAVFESGAPIALTTGLVEHDIFVSSGLVSALSLDQLDVVLAHERQHVAARDPLWRSAAAVAACLHLPGTRRAILRDLHLACEQSCDEAAARKTDDRAFVAQTILEVTKLLEARGAAQPRVLSGFGGHHVIARVEALLADAPSPPRRVESRVLAVVAALAAVALLAGAEPVHHGVETVLAVFAR